ncbi:MAG: excinuclease ABC subunit UvrA [Gammaproteobacteria bacterium]|nr:excinuclease ABC subunit UvrA [Gammaproteobacteria bacterium]
MNTIRIEGARTHNLKNITIELPRDKLIVITGPSGSGKSSLAFDTIYAEGQRRYVESLSAYARQFLSMMEKPDIDHIEGLSPAISIEQKATSHNPRSTVGTVTEIYDYLRLLFARAGEPRCPEHQSRLTAQTVSQMVDSILTLPEGEKLMLLAPVVVERKGEFEQLFAELRAQGYLRARIDGDLFELDDLPKLELRKKHTIEVVIDRFKVRSDLRQRLADSIETTLKLSDGLALVVAMETASPVSPQLFSSRYACPHCNFSLPELEPRLFSFNNPAGACSECDGLGVKQFFDRDRVVQQPEKSLAEGAIRGWDRSSPFYFQLLNSLASHFNFSIDTPFADLCEKIQNIILFGSGEEAVNLTYQSERFTSYQRTAPFEGIIPNLTRRYHDTDSESVREELSRFQSQQPCESCKGSRLNLTARNVFLNNHAIHAITALAVTEAIHFFNHLSLPGWRGEIAAKIVKEITARLTFLENVGLDYLNLNRSADTLSGGEAQRIRLASQIGAGLVGVMYILDEPSIGLHQRDNQRLLQTLFHLRDLGNTVIVVEHDEEAMRSADHLVDIGPGAGVHGGQVVASGTANEVMADPNSLTGRYLAGLEQISYHLPRRASDPQRQIALRGARGNNLKNITVNIPVGLMSCITGVSGSGKSTLINDTLYRYAANTINHAHEEVAAVDAIDGLAFFDKIVDIDQSPIGRTPRSNPATYTGLFTPIRELFAATQEARTRGYQPGRFSFNVRGGRCEACKGDGLIKVEMHFLPDVYVACDQCQGKRYNRETLEVRYKGLSIFEVLDLTVEDALANFSAIPVIARKLQTLVDVGLGYIRLGQAATTLSGGEAQRIKLARELSKRDTGKTLYILDEPTTGLHFADIRQLLLVLERLCDHGNTIVIIEHNLDVIKCADWIIDLGPEGGSGGGEVLVCGTPEAVALAEQSHTGKFLRPLLNQSLN